jgi:EAL domain-containing protein (putative c-di-GMP-specific phosphodiesterase class I)
MLGTLQKPVRMQDLRAMLRKAINEKQTVSAGDLSQAIKDDQLIVHYQPKVDLGSERQWDIKACEALVRWEHPRYGLLMPDRFIALAENSDLILPLTNCVLGMVLRQLREWDKDGLALSVAVNIAPQLLGDLALPDKISGLVSGFDVSPSRLILEITETGAMTDTSLTMDILTRFRLKGFGLSIDDFGTGYSSLIQLHRMPFNEMKIDRSFVMELIDNEESKKIVSSIAGLGHSLGLSLCAEGIEDEEALMFLRSLECETGQGYLISRPVPPAEMAELVFASASKSGWNRPPA